MEIQEKEREQEEQKREARKQRRRASQWAARGILLFAILAVLGLGVFAYLSLRRWVSQKIDELNGCDLGTPPTAFMESVQQSQAALPEESLVAPETVAEETEDSPSPEEQLDAVIGEIISGMTLEEKVAGLFWLKPTSFVGASRVVRAGEMTQKALAQHAIGGLLYDKAQVEGAEQLKTMLSQTDSYAKYPLFLGMREYGIQGSALVKAGLLEAQTLPATEEEAYARGKAIGEAMAQAGLGANLAPLAELSAAEWAYGTDPQTVSALVAAQIRGQKESGISSVVGLFPGAAAEDAAEEGGRPLLSKTLEEWQASDALPFAAAIAAGAEAVVVSHAAVPAIAGDNTPASMSKRVVTDLLRKEMGFAGVILTQELDAEAVAQYYGADEAAIMAIRAGCDMLLCPEDFPKAYQGVLGAIEAGTISLERVEDSLYRIYRIKFREKLESGE